MYSQSWEIMKEIRGKVGLTILTLMAYELIKTIALPSMGEGPTFFVTVAIYSFLAYHAHLAILFPGQANSPELSKKLNGFMAKLFLLYLPLVIVPGIVAIIVLTQIDVHILGGRDEAIGLSLIISGLAMGLTFVIVFGAVGTVLPAFVFGKNMGFSKALKRRKLPVMLKIIAGPGVVTVVSLGIGILLPLNGIGDELMVVDGFVPNVPSILLSCFVYAIDTYSIVMMAYILSSEYQQHEGIVPGLAAAAE